MRVCPYWCPESLVHIMLQNGTVPWYARIMSIVVSLDTWGRALSYCKTAFFPRHRFSEQIIVIERFKHIFKEFGFIRHSFIWIKHLHVETVLLGMKSLPVWPDRLSHKELRTWQPTFCNIRCWSPSTASAVSNFKSIRQSDFLLSFSFFSKLFANFSKFLRNVSNSSFRNHFSPSCRYKFPLQISHFVGKLPQGC